MKIVSFSALLLVLLVFTGCERAVESGPAARSEKSPGSKEAGTEVVTNGHRHSSQREAEAAPGLPARAAAGPALPEKQQHDVVDAVATILGSSAAEVDLDRPIIDPARGIEEFDLMEILLEIEDRFEVEIDEAAIEAATGSRFAEVQTKLTPRLFLDIVAEASKNPE